MNLEFRITLTTMRLYNGRRSVYASITLGRRSWFVSRWDTARVARKAGHVDLWRGPLMTWYAGGF